MPDRTVVRLPPPVDLREMLLALRDVLKRAELFTHHAIKREALSVRQRMGEVLAALGDGQFHRFESLFNAEEGKLGVVVTFLSILELAKEQLLEIVQEAPLAPIYVKSLAATDRDAANDDGIPIARPSMAMYPLTADEFRHHGSTRTRCAFQRRDRRSRTAGGHRSR